MTQDMHVYGFKKRATSKMNHSTYTLSILLEQLRSSLGAGKEQLRSSLGYAYSEVTARRQRGYVSSLTRLRLVIITLLTLMTLGITCAWGQEGTDRSGYYYIINLTIQGNNTRYDTSNPQNGYYLCPAAPPANPVADYNYDAVYYDGNADKQKPYLTTYQKGRVDDAVWKIEFAETNNHIDYYYIKYCSENKYLTYNNPIIASDAHRIAVHLQTEKDGEYSMFCFETGYHDATSFYIRPRRVTTGNRQLNPTNKNYNQYYGSTDGNKKTKVRGNDINLGGMVGLYSSANHGDDQASQWFLEKAAPIISYNSNLIEISYIEDGAVIYYTTDGTEPPTSGDEHIYSDAFAPADGVTTIKAVAVVGGKVSGVATYTTPVLCGTNHKYLFQSQKNEWNTDDFHFYMVPGDDHMVNTTSLFRPSMEWYFMGAGVENGVQYYYIVNNDNSEYLAYESNKVHMAAFGSGGDKFKFSIVASPTAGTYNIRPYGINSYLYKDGENSNNKVISLNNNNTFGTTRWKFVTDDALDKKAPFTVSDGSSRTHYQLRSSGDEYYVKAPASAGTFATMVEAASADENTYWYLEEAATATSEDWLTYYYIRNAKTGEYLYYTTNGNQSDNNQAFKTSATLGEAGRYQFAWARSTTEDYYFIVPKMLNDESLNNISTMNRNNTTLRVQKVRATGTSAWTFVPTPFCFDPVITQATDGTRTVTITCPTPGVDIYYRLDGEDPVVPAAGDDPVSPTFKYTAPFVPDVAADQIKAIAVNRTYTEGTASSTIVPVTLPKYTYHIVNLSGELAVSKADVRQAAGTPLSGYSSIPTDLQSSYISDEEIKFYSWEGDFDASKLLIGENKIEKTPDGDANIYITYTTKKLGSKFLTLTNSAPYNIKNDAGKCQYVEGSTLKTDAEAAEYKSDRQYLWYFLGADPYKVTVQNVGTNKWLTYSDPTLSVGESSQTYILKGTAKHTPQTKTAYEDVTLIDASGNTFTIRVNTVVLPIRFTLIDRQNLEIQSGIDYDGTFALPDAWQSPVAIYHYWKKDAFTTIGSKTEPFVFNLNSATL